MALEARAVMRACNDALRVPQFIAADRSHPANVLMQDEMKRGVTLSEEEVLQLVADRNILHVSSAGFSHIEVWGMWIRQLVAMFEAVGLPATVRGDTDKNKAGRQSPFIEFLKWLQSVIPGEYRRRIGDSTLAREVIEARRAPFREPKWSLSDIE
jgi:hypothetical protein